MTKSMHSKWKRVHKRQRAMDEAANIAARLVGLNNKLQCTAQGGISKIPLEDPETRFHFRKVHNRAGERLELEPMTTNPYGKSNTSAPHPQANGFDLVPKHAPVAGKAFTKEDELRLEKAQNTAPLADDEPFEITLDIAGSAPAAAKRSKKEPSSSVTQKLSSMVAQKGVTAGSKKIKEEKSRKRMVKGVKA